MGEGVQWGREVARGGWGLWCVGRAGCLERRLWLLVAPTPLLVSPLEGGRD